MRVLVPDSTPYLSPRLSFRMLVPTVCTVRTYSLDTSWDTRMRVRSPVPLSTPRIPVHPPLSQSPSGIDPVDEILDNRILCERDPSSRRREADLLAKDAWLPKRQRNALRARSDRVADIDDVSQRYAGLT